MPTEDTSGYRDASLPVQRRVDDLLDRMTVEELVAQLLPVPAERLVIEGGDGDDVGQLPDAEGDLDRDAASDLLEHGIGHLTRLAGGGGLEPERAAGITDEVQRFLVEETHLGIPAVPHEECLSGYMGPDGTTFPPGYRSGQHLEPRTYRRDDRAHPRATALDRMCPRSFSSARYGQRSPLGPDRGDVRGRPPVDRRDG